jgi:hypothetical protein
MPPCICNPDNRFQIVGAALSGNGLIEKMDIAVPSFSGRAWV